MSGIPFLIAARRRRAITAGLTVLYGLYGPISACTARPVPADASLAAAALTTALPRAVQGRDLFVVPNPHNALSTTVVFDARGIDSARVVYWADGEPRRATPFSRARGVGRIVTLGLLPTTPYFHVVERARAGTVMVSDTVAAATGQLPEYLRRMHMRVEGTPTSGLVLTAVADSGRTGFVVAFDSTGLLRWYREFPGELPTGETKQHPNGDFTVFLGRTPGWMPFPGSYEQFRPTGEVVRAFTAPPPLHADNHELVLTFRDSVFDAAHFFSFSTRQMDLSPWGGPRDTLVAGHQLLRVTADGAVHTVLDGWDHFGWEDRIEPPRDTLFDFDHPNSIDFDHDGNYVVSYRNMGEITKIDARTGAIIWRLGGRNNQFSLRGDPLRGFSAQHSVRVMANGNLLVYDNGTRHSPPETRVVEYRLDGEARTATMVWEYRHTPPLYVPYTGSVQRLVSGNTVVGFSNRGLVTEVRPDGTVAWEGALMLDPDRPGDFYRAIKIASLYGFSPP
ncbi:MAG: arylsulfotransferase family protein [Gemmatimonadaceae bacterium]